MPSDRLPAFFIGEHLALDFLNTLAQPEGEPVEWLSNGNDLVDWLLSAGAIELEVATKMKKFGKKSLDEVAEQAREFREWLRGFVKSRMGKSLRATAATFAPLNDLLSTDHSVPRVEEHQHQLQLCQHRTWDHPQELLQPIAHAVADLVCHHDFRLIRACEGTGCVLLFLDRTKAHSRRWCSMAICGNRAKVAAHRARKAGS